MLVLHFVEISTRKHTFCFVVVAKCDLIESNFPADNGSNISQAVEDKLLEVAGIETPTPSRISNRFTSLES